MSLIFVVKLDVIGQLLKRHNLPKLIQEEMDNLNKPISTKETESMINNFPKQKAPGSDGFIDELYQTFKEEIMPILYTLT